MKGGKAAEKLMKRHHHADAEESPLANDEAAFAGTPFSAPAATPVVEQAPPQQNSWGSLGSMLGVRHKTAPAQPAPVASEADQEQAAAEELAGESRPAEVQPVRRAAKHLRKGNDYTGEMKVKQNADDNAVHSLLSMVAQLKGGKSAERLADKYDHSSHEEAQSNPLANDMGIFGGEPAAREEPPPAEVEASHATEVATVMAVSDTIPSPRKNNLFLDSLTSSLGAFKPTEKAQQWVPHHPVAVLAKQNSYLKEFDMLDKEDSYFKGEETKKAVVKMPKRKASKLDSWLNPEPEAPMEAAPAPMKAQAPVNRYLADLS